MQVYMCTEMCDDGLFGGLNFIVFDRNSNRLGNGVLYASVNPEYFSAADGELLGCTLTVGGPLIGELLGVLLEGKRGPHYFEGPVASDPSSLTLLKTSLQSF